MRERATAKNAITAEIPTGWLTKEAADDELEELEALAELEELESEVVLVASSVVLVVSLVLRASITPFVICPLAVVLEVVKLLLLVGSLVKL